MKQLLFSSITVSVICFASSCLKVDPEFRGPEVNLPSDSATFVIIGDYGQDSPQEAEVAQMVKGWNPDFIITVGDNNYPSGSGATIVNNVGKHYCDFIYNPDAPSQRQCNGKASKEKLNRFFPAPGNHDNYSIPPIKPYLDYFTLPGDERNYEFVWGPVHFFSLNSGANGNISEPARNWLEEAIVKNQSPFNLVYFHHPPYSSGYHGSTPGAQLPFSEWGVDAVVTGHEHFYARVTDKYNVKPTYLIIGNSGNENLYDCNANPLDEDRFNVDVCDNGHFGAIRVSATSTQVLFEYFTVDDALHPRDVFIINK
jgi:tartrate-resistant acid phosphatase type 5